MKTSFFARIKNHPNAVSIAGKSPRDYRGKEYKKLAPSWDIFSEYKKRGDELKYIQRYYDEILSKLNAREVYDELGEDSILLCYENPDKFCHRHLVAEWFKVELGIEVKEIEFKEFYSFYYE